VDKGLSYHHMLISFGSSYGQNLDTTTYLPETLFCIILCIAGLVLFSLLIGNMEVRLGQTILIYRSNTNTDFG